MNDKGDNAIMHIGKKGKLATQSLRPHFEVGKGTDGAEEYVIVADMMERTYTIRNNKDEVICQIAKTTKALIQNAVLGSGSESTIDVAPGVDCSTILAIVYGLGQVGKHFVKDAAKSYVIDPIFGTVTDTVVETAGLEDVAQAYTDASNQAIQETHKLDQFKKFFDKTFG
jgi:metal-dependent amidase/aminoacylase/carboxypeptidase family protein